MRILPRAAALATVALTLGACAGTPEGPEAAPSVDIRVVNQLRPTTALTVHFMGPGERELLGTVVPAGERTFRFHPSDLEYQGFQLSAETGTGREITSPPFALRRDARVVWNVEANTIETP